MSEKIQTTELGKSGGVVDRTKKSQNATEGGAVDVEVIQPSKSKLSHILLDKQVKEAVKKGQEALIKDETKIDALLTDLNDQDQEKSVYIGELAQIQIARQKNNIEYSKMLDSLGLDNETFLKLFDKNYLTKYLAEAGKGTKEKIESAQNLYVELCDINNNLSTMGLLLNHIKKEISKTIHKIDKLQNEKDKKIEEINKILRDGWLDQFKYLGEDVVSISDSVLGEDVDNELKKIIYMYKNPDKVEKFGLTIPKTILFQGPQNSGKTFAAKVLKNELGQDMYHIKAQDIYAGEISDPNAIIESIFAAILEKEEKCIIFLDEIDKILENVEDTNYQKFINTIISNISKIKESPLDIVIIGAITNKSKVDSRFFKNDLFPKQIYLSDLTQEGKQKLFDIETKKYPNVNFSSIDFDKTCIAKSSDISAEGIKQIIKMAVENTLLENGETTNLLDISISDIDNATKTYTTITDLKNRNLGFSKKN